MRASTKLGALAAVAVGLGMAGSALGYTLTGLDWAWQADPLQTPFYTNRASFPSSAGTSATIGDALVNGLSRWGNDGGADFSFNWGGHTTATSFRADGTFIGQYSNTNPGGGTLAIAQILGFGGNMTECDIRFYARNDFGTIAWRSSPNGASGGAVDLEQVATHEWGHCTGLDHSNSNAAVMYFAYRSGSPSNRELTQDDRNGLQAMYGTGGSTGTADLTLLLLGDLQAGQPVQFSVGGADPGERVYLVGSSAGVGPGPCPAPLGGDCLDIRAPTFIIGNRTANLAGSATFNATVPSTYGGFTVGFQALVIRPSGTVFSAPFETVVLAP